MAIIKRSPPARGRGLKPEDLGPPELAKMSPPARGRGLKQVEGMRADGMKEVAPRAGAWIETWYGNSWFGFCRCRPPRGGVD